MRRRFPRGPHGADSSERARIILLRGDQSLRRGKVRKDRTETIDRRDQIDERLFLFPKTPQSMAYKYTGNASPKASPQRSLTRDKTRILIVGHANAGKTSILQRVADTTQSPDIYRGHERVRDYPFNPTTNLTPSPRFNLVHP